MKLRIWEEGAPVDEDTCYFRLEYDESKPNALDISIVHPDGEHEWYVLGISERGLVRYSSLPSENSPADLLPVPFPLDDEERVALVNEDLVIRD